jgi:hypothetical protein
MHILSESRLHALQRFAPDPEAVYTLDAIAHLADVPRHTVLLCCRHHLIEPHVDPVYGGYYFEAGTIQILKRVDYLHRECGINFAGIRIILGLMEEVERLRERTRSW